MDRTGNVFVWHHFFNSKIIKWTSIDWQRIVIVNVACFHIKQINIFAFLVLFFFIFVFAYNDKLSTIFIDLLINLIYYHALLITLSYLTIALNSIIIFFIFIVLILFRIILIWIIVFNFKIVRVLAAGAAGLVFFTLVLLLILFEELGMVVVNVFGFFFLYLHFIFTRRLLLQSSFRYFLIIIEYIFIFNRETLLILSTFRLLLSLTLNIILDLLIRMNVQTVIVLAWLVSIRFISFVLN